MCSLWKCFAGAGLKIVTSATIQMEAAMQFHQHYKSVCFHCLDAAVLRAISTWDYVAVLHIIFLPVFFVFFFWVWPFVSQSLGCFFLTGLCTNKAQIIWLWERHGWGQDMIVDQHWNISYKKKKCNDPLLRFLKLMFTSLFYIFNLQVVISKASKGYKKPITMLFL